MSQQIVRLRVRILAWVSGMLLAGGVAATVFAVTGWLGGGLFTGRPFLGVAVVALATGWTLRRKLMSPALRTTATAGALASVAVLTVCAGMSGFIDTKMAGFATALRSDLISLASAQDDFKRDSGRYAVALPPDFHFTSGATHHIALTKDGWTASVTQATWERTCAIFVGSTPIVPAVAEREPTCARPPFHASDYAVGVVFLAAGAMVAAIARALEGRTQTVIT